MMSKKRLGDPRITIDQTNLEEFGYTGDIYIGSDA